LGAADFSVNYEKTTWVHRLDPRTKLVFILVFATVPLFFTDFPYLLGCALLVAPVWISARIDPRPISGLLWAIVVFSVTILVFATFYNYEYPDEHIWFRFGPLQATDTGFLSGLMLAFRAAIPSMVALILICTTRPAFLAKAMMKMKVPIPVAFMMMGALRMFPLVYEEMQNIKTAQIIRGVKYGGLRNNFRAFQLAVFPLLINSLRKSRTTGIAVDSKGFGKRAWKDYYQEFHFRLADWLLMAGCLVFTAAAVYIRFVLGLGVNPYVHS